MNDPAIVRRRVRVTGRVQGVGYRESCRSAAAHTGVSGTVRNRPDGSVEAELEGPAPLVEQMIEWCRRGPRLAHVRAVEVTNLSPTGATGFTITFG